MNIERIRKIEGMIQKTVNKNRSLVSPAWALVIVPDLLEHILLLEEELSMERRRDVAAGEIFSGTLRAECCDGSAAVVDAGQIAGWVLHEDRIEVLMRSGVAVNLKRTCEVVDAIEAAIRASRGSHV